MSRWEPFLDSGKEWSGLCVVEVNSKKVLLPSCIVCGGIKPDDSVPIEEVGHKKGCVVQNTIKE